MKLACLLSFAFVLSAGALAAQQGKMNDGRNVGCLSSVPLDGTAQQKQDAKTKTTVCQAQEYPHCPIAMRVQHVADGEMVKTGSAHPQGTGQWLRLTLIAPDSRRVVTATLTIRGLSPKGRAMDVLKNENDSFDTVTQQIVHFTAGPDRHDLANLWVPGMTAVRTIEISSVTYADGSTWKHYGDMTCRVTPDGFMSVGGR